MIQECSISDIAQVFNGKTPSVSEQRTEGYPVLKIRDTDSLGNFKGKFESFVDFDYVSKYEEKKLESGDFLILNAAHSASHVGSKTFYANCDHGSPLITGEWLVVRTDTTLAYPGYIRHYLSSEFARKKFERLVKGIHLYPKDVGRIKLNLPNITEQRRIASILDKAEALRSKRREAIAKLDQLLQSVFLEMFGDPVTNPKNWPVGNLTHLGALDRGISKHRPRGAPELLGGIHPLIQTGDVSRAGTYIKSYKSTYSDLGLAQSKKWPKGTLCITIAANIAETAILDFEACFPDSVVGFTSQKPGGIEYVCMLLSFLKKILDEKAPQVAQKNINLEILRNLPVPIPLQNDQIKWANFFKEIENQKNQLRRSQDIFENLALSLQTQFFTQ